MSNYVKPSVNSMYSDEGNEMIAPTAGITWILGPVAVVAGAVAVVIAGAGVGAGYNLALAYEVSAAWSEVTWSNAE